MKNNIITIVKMLKEGNVSKKSYEEPLLSLEKSIKDLFNKWEFNVSIDTSRPFYTTTTDERLRLIKEKELLVKENYKIALPECIEYFDEKFNDFLNEYNIGYIHEMLLDNYGNLSVTINCDISCGIFSNNKMSDKVNFENQMKRLTDYGFDLNIKNNDTIILDNESNHIKLKELLENIGADYIKITTEDSRIDSVFFYLDLEKFDKETFNNTNFYYEKTEDLNPDEINKLLDLCRKINIENLYSESLKDKLPSLMSLYFLDMCKIVGIETELSKIEENKHSSEKEKNTKINEITMIIGKEFPVEKISETVREINRNISGFCLNNINFSVDTTISRYGNTSAKLTYFNSKRSTFKEKLLTKEELKSKFITTDNLINENIYIIDCKENRETIINTLKEKIPSIEFTRFESVYKNNEWIIENIYCNISNLSEVFNLTVKKETK